MSIGPDFRAIKYAFNGLPKLCVIVKSAPAPGVTNSIHTLFMLSLFLRSGGAPNTKFCAVPKLINPFTTRAMFSILLRM
jgi:hypothetical protein